MRIRVLESALDDLDRGRRFCDRQGVGEVLRYDVGISPALGDAFRVEWIEGIETARLALPVQAGSLCRRLARVEAADDHSLDHDAQITE